MWWFLQLSPLQDSWSSSVARLKCGLWRWFPRRYPWMLSWRDKKKRRGNRVRMCFLRWIFMFLRSPCGWLSCDLVPSWVRLWGCLHLHGSDWVPSCLSQDWACVSCSCQLFCLVQAGTRLYKTTQANSDSTDAHHCSWVDELVKVNRGELNDILVLDFRMYFRALPMRNDMHPNPILLINSCEHATWITFQQFFAEILASPGGFQRNVCPFPDDLEINYLEEAFIRQTVHHKGSLYICGNKDTIKENLPASSGPT